MLSNLWNLPLGVDEGDKVLLSEDDITADIDDEKGITVSVGVDDDKVTAFASEIDGNKGTIVSFVVNEGSAVRESIKINLVSVNKPIVKTLEKKYVIMA